MFRIFAVVLGVLVATTIFAQSRRDCDEIVGRCQATVKEVPTDSPGARFKLQANTEQCSIVEWSVDSDRGMTTIWDDGEEVSRVTPRKPGGAIKVHSCRVCKDRRYPGKSSEAGAVRRDFCTVLDEVNSKCGMPSMGSSCNSGIEAEMKAQWAGLEASRQRQLKLAADAEQVAAGFERNGMQKEARDARASAERSRRAAASLQCLATSEATLFQD